MIISSDFIQYTLEVSFTLYILRVASYVEFLSLNIVFVLVKSRIVSIVLTGTFSNNEDSDEMAHNMEFHHGLNRFVRLNRSSAKEVYL